MRRCAASFLGLLLIAVRLHAAETMPPAPQNHFNDYADVVAPAAARQLNAELAQFERDTSNQIVVAIYPHMQSSSSVADYTFRVAQSWGVGTKAHSNGAVLFVFTQDRQLFIQVGYGLEGALPDALCKQIIENEITPKFRVGDYTGGLTAGVHAMLAAAKGEYRGSGQTVRERQQGSQVSGRFFGILFLVMVYIAFRISMRRSYDYNRWGRRSSWWGGGGWGGGGWGGGGGGTFSGGGGSFGGGGAGGSW